MEIKFQIFLARIEPIRQGVRDHFGGFSVGLAAGVRLRHDHGSVYLSDDFPREVRFLGMESSPAFDEHTRRHSAHAAE